MKIKKIIAVDLDGTLLNDRRRVSFKARKILRKLNHEGYMIVLASGRPWRSIEDIYYQIGCFGPVIAYNGAYVFHPKDKSFKPLYKPFNIETIKDIYSKVENVTSSFMCESLTTVYVNKKDKYLKKYFWYRRMKVKEGNINKILNVDPMTCIILRPSSDDVLVDEACANRPDCELRHWTKSNYAELGIINLDKSTGLKYIADSYNIKTKDVMAFGDADNDFNMLKFAGKAYGMSNTKAQRIIDNFELTQFDNAHDGVALTLKQLFLDSF